MTLDAEGVKIDDGQAIRNSVIDLTEAAGHLNTHAGNIKRAWSGLGAVYRAPEQEDVLAAMDKPATEATDLKNKMRTAGRALGAYGERCIELQARKNQLKIDIAAFYKNYPQDGGGPTGTIPEAVIGGAQEVLLLRAEEDLAQRIYQLQADLDEAQRTCANAISAIYGGPHYEAADQASVWDKSVYGLTASGYDQLTRTGTGLDGKDIAWGVPRGWTGKGTLPNIYMAGQGAIASFLQLPNFAKDLIGADGAGEAGAAWSGLGRGGLDLLMVFNPAGPMLTAFGVGPWAGARERTGGMLKSIFGMDSGKTAPAYTAGGFVPDILAALETKGGSLTVKQALEVARRSSLAMTSKFPRNIGDAAAVKQIVESATGSARLLIHDMHTRIGPAPAIAGGHGGSTSPMSKSGMPDMNSLHNEASDQGRHRTPQRTGSGAREAPGNGSGPHASEGGGDQASGSGQSASSQGNDTRPDAHQSPPDPDHGDKAGAQDADDSSTSVPDADGSAADSADATSPSDLGYEVPQPPSGYPHLEWPDFPFKPLDGGRFESPEGLVYEAGSRESHRVYHIAQHGFPNSDKPRHSVFKDRDDMWAAIDEAWRSKGQPVAVDPDGRTKYIVPMNREIGTQGETRIAIVVDTNTNNIVTSFPQR